MKNNFDLVAPIYDLLVRLVFGDQLDIIQQNYLNHLQPNSRILIVGGGTGKILEWLPEDKGLSVDYVEVSSKMIDKARLRNCQSTHIDFYQIDIMSHEGKFDYIIANFFLDCFNRENLNKVLDKFGYLLDKEGKLIVSDFSPPQDLGSKSFILLMHVFFKITSRLESDHLQDIHSEILINGFSKIDFVSFQKGRLFSAIYEKMD